MLHANLGNDNWVPLPFLGEGAASLVAVILAIADSQGGIVLLDEVDSRIHHSKLNEMWTLIIQASAHFETQIFASTHSQESLEALVEAVEKTDYIDKTVYFRLRRDVKTTKVTSVAYKGRDIIAAVHQNWEVR